MVGHPDENQQDDADTVAAYVDSRAAYVRALRARYLAGTLDDVLIPEDADPTELIADLRDEG